MVSRFLCWTLCMWVCLYINIHIYIYIYIYIHKGKYSCLIISWLYAGEEGHETHIQVKLFYQCILQYNFKCVCIYTYIYVTNATLNVLSLYSKRWKFSRQIKLSPTTQCCYLHSKIIFIFKTLTLLGLTLHKPAFSALIYKTYIIRGKKDFGNRK